MVQKLQGERVMAHDRHPLVLSRAQSRRVDAIAMEQFAMPGVVLMENASRGLALHALHLLGWPQKPPQGSVLIVCGGGNNGGDGFAAARHLHIASVPVTLVLAAPIEGYQGDAATNLKICQKTGLKIIEAADDPVSVLEGLPPFALVMDGLFGTGLSTPPRAPSDGVIDWMNRQEGPVLSIDIPSGLDCDTGEPLGQAVKAWSTATFVAWKKGFSMAGADQYTGKVVVTDIGIPPEVIQTLMATP